MTYSYSGTRRRGTRAGKAHVAPVADQQTLLGPSAAAEAAVVDFVPSAYQLAAFDFIRAGTALHARVKSVAGSGKTSTVVTGAGYLPRGTKALFVAFNKHNAEAIAAKFAKLGIQGMDARTSHSLGYKTIASFLAPSNIKIIVRDYKYRDLIDQSVEYHLLPPGSKASNETKHDLRRLMTESLDYCRSTLTDPLDKGAFDDMADHFALAIPDDEQLETAIRTQLSVIMRQGQDMAATTGVIDYSDMVWLPNVLGLVPDQYDFLFVDEAQDISKAQRRLLISAIRPGGRSLWVGDPRQAIYGFAGADAASFDAIKQELGAFDLDLTVCYRCPPNIIELAKQYCPEIEAVPGKADGVIEWIKEEQLGGHLTAGSMVLCRTTAPLVATCLRMLAAGKPAKMRGRDIGRSLMKTVQEVEGMPGYSGWDNFGTFLDLYRAAQEAKFAQRRNAESALQELTDRVEAIRACYESPVLNARSADELRAKIDGLFTDDNAVILFSTVHRAKGLEKDNVYILRPDLLPFSRGNQQEWQREQERNLTYVAYTRAMKSLFFVEPAA